MSELLNNLHINSILQKSRTTRSDLEKLLKKLNINASVDWQADFDPKIPAQVLNLGNGILGGTHWVAVDNLNKRYFDSFGQVPPPIIPKSYEWYPLQIQDPDYGHCGQYAALFIYYSKKNELDQFFNLFNQR